MIKDADIVLAGVGQTDVFLDYDYVKRHEINISNIKRDLIDYFSKKKLALNDKLIYVDESVIESSNIDFLRSDSSYEIITKREEIASFYMDEIILTDTDLETILKTINPEEHQKIKSLVLYEKIAIDDIKFKMFAYSSLVVQGKLKLTNRNLSIYEYSLVSKFAHKWFGLALREYADYLSLEYKSYMEKKYNVLSNNDLLLKIPDLSISTTKRISDSNQDNFKPNSLRYSIRYHFIYNTDYKNQGKAILKDLIPILSGEWEKEFDNYIELHNVNIYFGWSHSLFIFNKEDDFLLCKYILPLEVVLANWLSLNVLAKKIDYAIAYANGDMLSLNNGRTIKKTYKNIQRDIHEFSMKLDRIIEYFDSYTVTNNPTNYKLIDMQQNVFLQDKKIQGLKNKMVLLNNLVTMISRRQHELQSATLNTILLILTLMSIIGNAHTIYQIFSSENTNMMLGVVTIVVSTILLVILYIKIKKNKY